VSLTLSSGTALLACKAHFSLCNPPLLKIQKTLPTLMAITSKHYTRGIIGCCVENKRQRVVEKWSAAHHFIDEHHIYLPRLFNIWPPLAILGASRLGATRNGSPKQIFILAYIQRGVDGCISCMYWGSGSHPRWPTTCPLAAQAVNSSKALCCLLWALHVGL